MIEDVAVDQPAAAAPSSDRPERVNRWLAGALVAVTAVAVALGAWRLIEPPAAQAHLPPSIGRAIEIVNAVAASGNPADARALESVYLPDAAIHEGDHVATGIEEIKGAALANAAWGWSIERSGAGTVVGSYVAVPMTYRCELCSTRTRSGVMVFEIVQGRIGNQWWFGP